MYATLAASAVIKTLHSSEEGLRFSDVEERIKEYGYNEIPEKSSSLLLLFLKQFHSVLVYILFAALALSIILPLYENHDSGLALTDFIDAIAIGSILILNAILGFYQERKAENSIAALKAMSDPQVRVRRDGQAQFIPSRELVPGDILLLEEGDKISADARIFKERGARVNESSLTGESESVHKMIDILSGSLGIADQKNMVFKGTVVTAGHLEVCVTATGTKTELGKVASFVSSVHPPPTPLEKSMESLGKWLGIVVLLFCGIIFGVGFWRGLPIGEILLASASLAVSAVPEGLPAIVTICLAFGVQRMINRRALTRDLDAIETLGSITVICTDKTGTITENRMKVEEVWCPSPPATLPADALALASSRSEVDKLHCGERGGNKEVLFSIAASCNNAHSLEVGDPTETGLLRAAQEAGVERLEIISEDVPFSSESKYMMTTHNQAHPFEGVHGSIQFIKGAPEVVVEMCDLSAEDREMILKKNEEMAGRALRVLAFAYKEPSEEKAIFVGLIGMMDPAREGVREAIAIADRAGIRTVMITGDHALTAQAIAHKVGIDSDVIIGKELEVMTDPDLQEKVQFISIFARVTPQHKVRILTALQNCGEIVAMGGDGVNDAPALKKAHVGFAMGKAGTDVARETAAMILTDDNFATVVEAVEEGRTIYDNINKFVVFLLRANFDELSVVFIAILSGIPLPYLPIHILLINLVTDSLPAMALALEKPEPGVMQRPPRDPFEHILKGEYLFIILAAILATCAAFFNFWWGMRTTGSVEIARTLVVTNSILLELTLVFTCRSKRSLFKIGIFSNRYLVGAVTIAFAVLLAALYSPLNLFLRLSPLSLAQWIVPVAWAVGLLVFFEGLKMVRRET